MTKIKLPNSKRGIDLLNSLDKRLSGKTSVKVGLPKDSNAYPNGESVVDVGFIHEFGEPTVNIPERSFLRSTLFENQKAYHKLAIKLTKRIVKFPRMTITDALGTIGEKFKGDVQYKISSGINPPLKSRDGTPLYDTGHLVQSITYKVDD